MDFNNLDERQLLLRGNVFQHGLILMITLTFVNMFLTDIGFPLVEGIWSSYVIVAITSATLLIEMIVNTNPRLILEMWREAERQRA